MEVSDDARQPLGTWWVGPNNVFSFKENFDFLTKKNTYYFKFSGRGVDSDGPTPDDIIVNFNGFKDDVTDYTEDKTIEFPGEFDSGKAEVKMRFYQ